MNLVKIEHLSKKYLASSAEGFVLNDLSLVIPKGKFIGLHGRSGSGKTTLLQIIGCLDQFDRGAYFFENVNVLNLSEVELNNLRRKKIGFIFQNFNLIPTLTVRENVQFPLNLLGLSSNEKKCLVDETLHQVGLSDFSDRFPSQLSGGQRQRVSIARAIVKRPLIIIADEPTANLDDETSEKIAELLVSIQKKSNVTILCSSHDHFFLENSDFKIKIQNGQVQIS